MVAEPKQMRMTYLCVCFFCGWTICTGLESQRSAVILSAFYLPRRLNTLRPRQNGCRFADDIFKCIFLNENEWISPRISLKFVPEVRINNIPALVQIMAWRRAGDKPLSEPMMVSLLTHICVTRPQWVKLNISLSILSSTGYCLYAYT